MLDAVRYMTTGAHESSKVKGDQPLDVSVNH